jgi:hypothetical protein
MKKKGRPQKPYVTSWNQTIDGLARRFDGRWRVIATDEHYTYHDEHTAVQRFLQSRARASEFIPIAQGTPVENAAAIDALDSSASDPENLTIRSENGRSWTKKTPSTP